MPKFNFDVERLIAKGIFFSNHAQDKLREENIDISEIYRVLQNGTPMIDNSATNNREHAWNRKPHLSIEHGGLTIVCCESMEGGILVVSAFHGNAHDIRTNPRFK